MDVRAGAGLASDTRSVDALRANAARDPKAAIKEAAKQFEALFMRELMKSMRQATLSSGMLDNAGSQMGTEMLDGQFSSQMAGLPGGLSEVIARHLARQLGGSEEGPAALKAAPLSGVAPARDAAGRVAEHTPERTSELSSGQAGFVQRHLHDARSAQAHSGIPASFMVAQAAHETGWGQREIRHVDGSSSHNLFGIKAGANWKGAVAEVTTTEVIDGEARKVKAKFRAYGSYAESFDDYARLITANPRYRDVLAQAGSASGFATQLQRAGYATDPHYAEKLTRTINATLRLQRAVT
jgi:peptidoglycan hydrolase FlgJ